MIRIEAVPNFSVGRDPQLIEELSRALSLPQVTLMHVDVGASANRSVFSMIGPPEAVLKAIEAAVQILSGKLDLRKHQGNHPRVGALDVCPLVPLIGLSLAEAASWAQQLGRALAERFNLPVYFYGPLATDPRRTELSFLRLGGFEALSGRMAGDLGPPDLGPNSPHESLGATLVTARPVMLAYNVHLPGARLQDALELARRLRQARQQESTLASVRFLGWQLEDSGLAQISTNLLDYPACGMAEVYQRISREAQRMGLSVEGSELVGLCPLDALIKKGQDLSQLGPAIRALGLDRMGGFEAKEKIIELNLLEKGLIHEVQSLGWDFSDQ
ncbi:MAG: glutamate formimidoyltransferase [bacterium]|nr:glutamate formimidoyltransferase [bacterium]